MAADAEFMQAAEPYRRELVAHCYRMLGSLHDAEDMVQDTLVRAWRSHGDFAGRSSLRTWLHQIATNRCLTELGRSSRRVLPSGIGAPEGDPGAPPTVAGPTVRWLQPAPTEYGESDPANVVAGRAELRLALVVGFQRLPPRQRAVLLLCDVLGFPAVDVAAILDTTLPSVKSALQRARRRLAEVPGDVQEIAEPADPRARALLDGYIAAFERADVDALQRLLVQDVVIEATPIVNWYSGRVTCIPFLRDQVLGAPGRWRMMATTANGQPAAAAWTRDDTGRYQPYGICVLTVTDAGIHRITSFGDPALLPLFGFGPEPARPIGTN